MAVLIINANSKPAPHPDDLLKQKICLIEDIFKAERLCYGLQVPDHEMWHRQPGNLFDYLYDCDIDTLDMIYSTACAEASQAARKLIGF